MDKADKTMNTISFKTLVSKDTGEIALAALAAFVFALIYTRSPVGITLLTLGILVIIPVALKKVEYAVAFLALILPFRDIHIVSIIHLKRLLIWSLFAYLLVRAVTRNHVQPSHKFSQFVKYSFWFFFALGISLIVAIPELGQTVIVNPDVNLKTTILSDGLVIVEAILLVYITYLSVETFEQAQRLIDAIIAVSTIVAILGIVQYYYGDPPTSIAWLFNKPETEFPHRATSVFSNPNGFGHFLAPAVGLGFVLAFLGTMSKKKRYLFLLPCLFLGIWGVFVSYSRAAVLQVFFGVVLSGVLYYVKIAQGKISWKFLVILVLIVGFIFAIIHYYEWYAQLRVQSNILQAPHIAIYKIKSIGDSDRKYTALMALKTFLRHPLIGVGHAVFAGKNIARGLEVHNQYLKLLCEMGLFGFIPFMLMLLSMYHTGFQVWKQAMPHPPQQEKIQIFLLLLFVGISIILFGFLFGDFLRRISISGYVWMFAGIIFALERQHLITLIKNG